jgi:hypothetical protein
MYSTQTAAHSPFDYSRKNNKKTQITQERDRGRVGKRGAITVCCMAVMIGNQELQVGVEGSE